MTSLASSAHGATPLTPSLMAFYATVATVIPVLFIALAVQSMTMQWLAVNWWRDPSDLSYVKKLPARPRAFRAIVLFTGGIANLVVLVVFVLILASGVVGELYAIGALYNGTDTSGFRGVVLSSVGFLVLAVATGPALAFVRADLELRQTWHKAAAPAPSTEPDKKDAEQDQQPDGPQPAG